MENKQSYPGIARYKKELAAEMGFSVKTFQRKLKSANLEIPRGLIPPTLQFEIYSALGWPQLSPNDAKWAKQIHSNC